MSRATDGGSLYPERIAVPCGASLLGASILITPLPGQLSVMLKNDFNNGGSLTISNIVDTYGSSSAISQQYLIGLAEIISFDMTGSFYLSAFGATQTVWLLRIRSQGTGN